MELLNHSLEEISSGIKKKKFSIKEVCQFFLDRITKYNSSLNAVVTLNEQAISRAIQMDQKIHQYRDLPLLGIPILLKDIFCTKDIRTTAGSRMLENFIPPYSAEIVQRLEKAGAIILGKCNQDEFAMGNSNEQSIFGPTKNPWNTDYVPGGSSGGSAVSVSAGFAPVSIGSDTGGSVRQPASFCNVVGIKPTYGRVSRYGMIAYASSLDQAGPLTVNVEDSALVLQVLSGADLKDMTSAQHLIPNWSRQLQSGVQKLKIGWLVLEDLVSPEVQTVMNRVQDVFKKHSFEIIPIHLSSLAVAVPTYYLISTSEASSNLARYDGVRYGYRHSFSDLEGGAKNLENFYSRTRGHGFGSEVKRRILMGTFCLSQGYYDKYYERACQVRRYIRDELLQIFSKVSVLVLPVSSTPAWSICHTPPGSLDSYLSDQFTVLANLAGLPSLSVPAGFSSKDLPIGIQLLAEHFNEQNLFNIAYFIQKKLGVVGRRPNV